MIYYPSINFTKANGGAGWVGGRAPDQFTANNVDGRTYVNGELKPLKVIAYHPETMSYHMSTRSTIDGTWELIGLDPTQRFQIVFQNDVYENSSNVKYNSFIQDWIYPQPLEDRGKTPLISGKSSINLTNSQWAEYSWPLMGSADAEVTLSPVPSGMEFLRTKSAAVLKGFAPANGPTIITITSTSNDQVVTKFVTVAYDSKSYSGFTETGANVTKTGTNNQRMSNTTGANGNAWATIGSQKTSGKYKIDFRVTLAPSTSGSGVAVGISHESVVASPGWVGGDISSIGFWLYRGNSQYSIYNKTVQSNFSHNLGSHTSLTNFIVSMFIDIDNGRLWWRFHSPSAGSWNPGNITSSNRMATFTPGTPTVPVLDAYYSGTHYEYLVGADNNVTPDVDGFTFGWPD